VGGCEGYKSLYLVFVGLHKASSLAAARSVLLPLEDSILTSFWLASRTAVSIYFSRTAGASWTRQLACALAGCVATPPVGRHGIVSVNEKNPENCPNTTVIISAQ